MRWKSAVSWGLSLLLMGSSLACSGCSDGGGGGGGGDETPSGEVEEYMVKGRVRDTQGNPLAGAEVVADNQLLHDSNVVGATRADGTYELQLEKAAATWKVSAQIQRQYNGRSYTLPLHPSNASPFAGNEGAVRDFEWKLTGARPEGGVYGFPVIFNLMDYVDPADGSTPTDRNNIELTLTPAGPRVDGSTGAPVTGRGADSGDGFGIQDVALGRYTITARYAPQGQAPRDLHVRVANTGQYAPSVTTDFESLTSVVHRIKLDLKFP